MQLLFNQPKSLLIRIWHWLIFLFFLASISTVIYGSTLFKTKGNISIVKEQVSSKGRTVSQYQAWAVAHEFSDKLWMLHKYIGYGLSILILLRIIIELFNSKDDKILSRIKNASSLKVKDPETKHYINVNYSYLVHYLLFFVMALTGLVLAFEDISWLDPFHKNFK